MKRFSAWWFRWYAAGWEENTTTNHRWEKRRRWIGHWLAKVDGDSVTGNGATGYDDDDNDGGWRQWRRQWGRRWRGRYGQWSWRWWWWQQLWQRAMRTTMATAQWVTARWDTTTTTMATGDDLTRRHSWSLTNNCFSCVLLFLVTIQLI